MAMDAECSFILMLLAPTETELLDGQICPPDSIQQSFFDDLFHNIDSGKPQVSYGKRQGLKKK
jgi:hypothetical protein